MRNDSRRADAVAIETTESKTIEKAIAEFISEKQTAGMSESVLQKYRRELKRFDEFMATRRKLLPHEVTKEDLIAFREGWEELYPSSQTRNKVQERLRGLLRFCYDAGYIARVPKLSPIKVDVVPTLPLTETEYQNLLTAVPEAFSDTTKAARVHAMVMLLRYTGLSIMDAVTLECAELKKAGKHYRIITSRTKTGTHVSVPLPDAVADEVIKAAALNESKKYVFWNTGTGKPQTAVTNWQHDLRACFRKAGIPNGHPHRLRDTFAVRLLEKGVLLQDVSKLLGHSSIKVTEKHYAAWVQSRQTQLDDIVTATF